MVDLDCFDENKRQVVPHCFSGEFTSFLAKNICLQKQNFTFYITFWILLNEERVLEKNLEGRKQVTQLETYIKCRRCNMKWRKNNWEKNNISINVKKKLGKETRKIVYNAWYRRGKYREKRLRGVLVNQQQERRHFRFSYLWTTVIILFCICDLQCDFYINLNLWYVNVIHKTIFLHPKSISLINIRYIYMIKLLDNEIDCMYI